MPTTYNNLSFVWSKKLFETQEVNLSASPLGGTFVSKLGGGE